MNIRFGRDVGDNLEISEHKEWLITNGIGGYACGTVSGLLTRSYQGLLLATLEPPLGITLMLTKLDETVTYNDADYPLSTNRWADGTIAPHGYKQLESFYLQGTIPVWVYACADALIEKRVWMQPGKNITYIQYKMLRGSLPLTLSLKALVNYRDRHSITNSQDLNYEIINQKHGIKIKTFPNAADLCLSAIKNQDVVPWEINNEWYRNFALAVEKYRGLNSVEDHLYAGNCSVDLNLEESVTIVASTEGWGKLEKNETRRLEEQELIKLFRKNNKSATIPSWIEQLVLAADRFIVDRPIADIADGKTIIAGYPWFGDWGRDTMISLPGLTLATGRYEIAKVILRTFAKYIDRGMLPNVFPDRSETPEYNTVDASLWYFEAIRDYMAHTDDKQLLVELFPALVKIIEGYRRGTRYNIHLDSDGLIYAGETGVQLTWMDAKVGNWVVTPRIGKPVEVNALWYNALIIMSQFASYLGKSETEYLEMAVKTREGFQRFWNVDLNYCYDVLDTPDGNDHSLRPNQIFAVSLPVMGKTKNVFPLLDAKQQKQVVDIVSQHLLTSHRLRSKAKPKGLSLSQDHPDYVGIYGGDLFQRDGAYHQGTVWGWLIGHFVQAHLKVYQNPEVCKSFLETMSNHLAAACVGSLSEIFDGDAPFIPRGAFAQAWSVAEVLRSWLMVDDIDHCETVALKD